MISRKKRVKGMMKKFPIPKRSYISCVDIEYFFLNYEKEYISNRDCLAKLNKNRVINYTINKIRLV